ncbi:uncharacterized protein DUF1801 [Nonlabens xylanidelens]|uniref:Uncharacterized protein DUF1801 n=1 Tax=Nonlabens xylanidelens TaxID=191564 RepID=A0A2S6INR9_9FLAO|nr:DUF1801 domain-containing protein [Nonlabens xylanidelens]PPK95869.1 uncharacterized protein DUF1801 [Nonlabens xylanidelens]PQJ22651.1 hypothetical protein BST94_03510 [Nonlabens xylanidelens]
MTSKATTAQEYLKNLPEDRLQPISDLRDVVLKNLPAGFEEGMLYGMLGYYVPKEVYEPGYHVGKEWTPLPFINIASQKNFIALYHSGIYANPELMEWFKAEYSKHSKYKLDMGKSCIRFKKVDNIPLDLIAELCQKMTPQEWVQIYESVIKK